MNSVEILLANKIRDAEPTLDVLGADQRLLQVACQDFINYLKFTLKESNMITEEVCLEEKFRQLLKEERLEVESFLKVWVSLWLQKWKQRVKLLFGDQNPGNLGKPTKFLAQGDAMLTKLECKREMMENVVFALIRSGEVCGTEMLAQNTLKTELGKEFSEKPLDTEGLLNVLNNSLRRAREVAQGCGPLIYVKIDKCYFCQ
jgi:hypothetical protein